MGDTSFRVGESGSGLSGSGLERWRLPVGRHPICSECWIRYICAGGCRQENFQANGDVNAPSSEGCRYQIRLVENVIGMLATQDELYRSRDRAQLDDLFVSCGRPVILNLREETNFPPSRHFHPL